MDGAWLSSIWRRKCSGVSTESSTPPADTEAAFEAQVVLSCARKRNAAIHRGRIVICTYRNISVSADCPQFDRGFRRREPRTAVWKQLAPVAFGPRFVSLERRTPRGPADRRKLLRERPETRNGERRNSRRRALTGVSAGFVADERVHRKEPSS